MLTVTIDIINDKALNLLRDLELLKLIRLRRGSPGERPATVDWSKYKGAMSRQAKDEVDRQLNELRSEWE